MAKTYKKLGYDEEQEKLRKQEQLQQMEKELVEARLVALGQSETEKWAKAFAEAKSKLIVTASYDFYRMQVLQKLWSRSKLLTLKTCLVTTLLKRISFSRN